MRGLVTAEVVVCVALLATAGVLARNFVRLIHVDVGFDADRIALMSLSLPKGRYETPEQRAAFLTQVEHALEARPEVASATVTSGTPPHTSFRFGVKLQAEDGPVLPTAKDDPGLLPYAGASPDYMQTIGATLLSGRALDLRDVGTDNVLIDETLARALWNDTRPGRRFRDDPENPWMTVVGVYRHMRYMGLDDRSARFGMIRPRDPSKASAFMTIAIRTRGAPAAVLPIAREVLGSLDPMLPISRLETAHDAMIDTIELPRFLARFMSGISAAALFLAGIGMYGVIGYSVARRRRDTAIRMALGANETRVRAMFVGEALIIAGIGIVAGGLLGAWIIRAARSMLYDLRPGDLVSTATLLLVVLAMAVLASLVPAIRASRGTLATALRAE